MSSLMGLFSLHRLPAGRRLFALRKVRSLAASDQAVVALVDDAIAHDTKVLELRGQWLVTRDVRKKYPARLVELDIEHDRIVSSMAAVAQGLSSGMEEDTPIGAAARRVAQRVFGAGVGPLTQVDFVQQRESTNTWLALLDGELADDVVLIGLAPMRDRLALVNKEFGQILDAFQPEVKVTYDAWRTEDRLGQEKLLRVVAVIAGKYCGARPGDDDMRTKLLAPILDQNDAVADTYRRRRPVTDIDPDNGEDVTPPADS